jgi:hypothetical protein
MRYGKTVLATLLILGFLSVALLARLAWAETGITRRGDGTGVPAATIAATYATLAGEDQYSGEHDLSGASVIVGVPGKGTHAINQNTANSDYVNVDGDTMTGVLAMPDGAAGTPSITGSDADSGFFFTNGGKDTNIGVDGVGIYKFTGTQAIFPAGSTTVPAVVISDLGTGFSYSAKAGGLIIVVDDAPRAWVNATDGLVADTGFTCNGLGVAMGNDALIKRDVNAGITASTTQSQGQRALTAEINEVATCANDNDVVTLPTAVVGLRVMVINNGAKTLQIFPASGDDLGAGVNTSETLASGSNKTYQAYDVTNWEAQ